MTRRSSAGSKVIKMSVNFSADVVEVLKGKILVEDKRG